ncbi:MAG: hypothetical protein IPH07_33965 [Deltaproteobacteria bacterium]|nr:hypothetical protein [Deltaproteobacteria bacterium]MBK8235186.1 hypothetical protein [Deltaproteobacteria bacterium]MBP7287316.1 hypothetical protein [Nannocystaceae bacterium]
MKTRRPWLLLLFATLFAIVGVTRPVTAAQREAASSRLDASLPVAARQDAPDRPTRDPSRPDPDVGEAGSLGSETPAAAIHVASLLDAHAGSPAISPCDRPRARGPPTA